MNNFPHHDLWLTVSTFINKATDVSDIEDFKATVRERRQDLLNPCTTGAAPTQRPNDSDRQKIRSGSVLIESIGETVQLSEPVQKGIIDLSDSLQLNEIKVLELWVTVSQPAERRWLEGAAGLPAGALAGDLPGACRALWRYERGCLRRARLELLKGRLDPHLAPAKKEALMAETDALLQAGLPSRLMAAAGDLLRAAQQPPPAAHPHAHPSAPAAAAAPLFGAPAPGAPPGPAAASPVGEPPAVARRRLHAELGRAAEALLFLYYQTQATAAEVLELAALAEACAKALHGLLAQHHRQRAAAAAQAGGLGPLAGVGGAFPGTAGLGQGLGATGAVHLPPPAAAGPHEEAGPLGAGGRAAALLGALGTLLAALACALDQTHELLDRNTGRPNTFGPGNALAPPGAAAAAAGDAAALAQLEDALVHRAWDHPGAQGVAALAWALFRKPAADGGRAAAGPACGPALRRALGGGALGFLAGPLAAARALARGAEEEGGAGAFVLDVYGELLVGYCALAAGRGGWGSSRLGGGGGWRTARRRRACWGGRWSGRGRGTAWTTPWGRWRPWWSTSRSWRCASSRPARTTTPTPRVRRSSSGARWARRPSAPRSSGRRCGCWARCAWAAPPRAAPSTSCCAAAAAAAPAAAPGAS